MGQRLPVFFQQAPLLIQAKLGQPQVGEGQQRGRNNALRQDAPLAQVVRPLLVVHL
jgi:hypothetical protein